MNIVEDTSIFGQITWAIKTSEVPIARIELTPAEMDEFMRYRHFSSTTTLDSHYGEDVVQAPTGIQPRKVYNAGTDDEIETFSSVTYMGVELVVVP